MAQTDFWKNISVYSTASILSILIVIHVERHVEIGRIYPLPPIDTLLRMLIVHNNLFFKLFLYCYILINAVFSNVQIYIFLKLFGQNYFFYKKIRENQKEMTELKHLFSRFSIPSLPPSTLRQTPRLV